MRNYSRYIHCMAAMSVFGLVAACTPAKVDRDVALGLELPERFVASEAEQESLYEDWLEDIASPTLRAVIDEALASNPDLLVTAARLNQAQAQLTIAGAARLPTLDASFNFNRLQNRFTGPTGETASVRQSNFNLSGRLNWELDVWGRLAAQDAAAYSDTLAAEADLANARLSLAGQVAQSWFALTTAQQQLNLAKTRVASFERSNGIVRSRYERGITTALDVYLSESNLASARSLLTRRENELGQAKRALEVLVGRYPTSALNADADLPEFVEDVPVGLPSELLSRRPDIQAAQARLIAADYRYAAARRALLPQFSLTVTAGERAETFRQFRSFSDLVYNLATNISQPIFRGGQLRANVRLEDARRDERLASYAGVLLGAFEEVENTLSAEIYLAEQVGHLRDAARQARAAERLAEQQYSRGITPLLNLLDAQRRYLDAQSQYLDVLRARVNNRVQLHLALGGPFEAADTPFELTGLNP
ncbi:MAG: efflux transporter outer membrane subunit [Sphingomonadales bacterium]